VHVDAELHKARHHVLDLRLGGAFFHYDNHGLSSLQNQTTNSIADFRLQISD
jgi:hypothetical protein